MDSGELRAAFLRRLTVDSKNEDRRRKDYNQAIFFPEDDRPYAGHAVFTSTTLSMVLAAFDRAVKDAA